MNDLKKMTNWEELEDKLEKNEKALNKLLSEDEIKKKLTNRVKGQDEIVSTVAKLLRLQLAKKVHQKPIASFLFLGPTGTGKTELAKAIAEMLYGDEKLMLRFDCSELNDPQMGTARLVGSSVGFVGSDQGGQLTRPMFANKKRVILFDEIEKAHPKIFDLFLQMMGDGRLTEQSTGNTADFTESIIILTSNAHAEKLNQIAGDIEDEYEKVNAIKGYLADSKVFRPEIIGRIDKVCMFKALEGMVIAEIALLKISKMAKEYGVNVSFVDTDLIIKILADNKKVSRFGIRELERIIFDMFSEQIINAREGGHSDIELRIVDKELKIVPLKK